MNKAAIKNYAIWARVQLIESCKQRAFEYGIIKDGENQPDIRKIGDRILSDIEVEQRNQLISQINEKGYSQVMEEAAYTWFNRFIALRFMEVNGYLPSKVRVFSNEDGEFYPEIMKQVMTLELDGLDNKVVVDLIDKQNNEELYKYLIITQCNALNSNLPYLFEKISNWTELLFPSNMLHNDSVIGQMISEIEEDDWKNEVEIIGWLYQYYISEKHEEVVDSLRGKAIKKEDIPAATQIFTPDWIVKYIVDNSLGGFWLEQNPNSILREKAQYYPKNCSEDFQNHIESVHPETIKILDPCVGSGHFLSYSFDILLEIYRECGWSDRDSSISILENNLHGLDIDERAAQLAYFAIMMKARKYNRQLFRRAVDVHIFAMKESESISDELVNFVARGDEKIITELKNLKRLFENAKECGSLIEVIGLDLDAMCSAIRKVKSETQNDIMSIIKMHEVDNRIMPLIMQARILSQKYDVVITNPPYMSKCSDVLKSFISAHYSDYKSDLFSAFISRSISLCKSTGYIGLMTPIAWMFNKSYQNVRYDLINKHRIASLVQLAPGSFTEAGIDVCAFVIANNKTEGKGIYVRLSEADKNCVQAEALKGAMDNSKCKYRYEKQDTDFNDISGMLIAYWASQPIMDALKKGDKLGNIAKPRQGMATCDNKRFLRFWPEVNYKKVYLNAQNSDEAAQSNKKWIPYNKGGAKKKWYGNNDYLINWENDGKEIKDYAQQLYGCVTRTIQNMPFYFKECFTWSLISTTDISFRYRKPGSIFDKAGMSCFSEKHLFKLLALCNSKIIRIFLEIFAPTINCQAGDIADIPVLPEVLVNENIEEIVHENISIAKDDWDTFETSWDFRAHPLAPLSYERKEQLEAGINSEERRKEVTILANRYKRWEQVCECRFDELKKNEEELNRIFIDIYGLQDELTSEVNDKDVTVRKADLQGDIRSLISYAVGCMMGRYSLDVEGLAFAGGEFDETKYTTFKPDKDAIIPICDDYYFDDDIVGRFIEFVKVVYGEDTLEENLQFIADALGGKGTAREIIRKYFIKDFYKDHLKVYQKRPIYWLFSSGKKNGFKALIYMHRYQPDMLARMRTDYVHEQQERYRTQLQVLEEQIEKATPSDRVKINKQINKLKDQSSEIQQYEEKIHHLADQMIEIDLDDGVKVNYAKFQDVLEKLK